MADAHVHGTHAVARANGLADRLSMVYERRGRSSILSRCFTTTNQNALGAAQARAVKEQPNVTCQSEAPRMGQSLSVEHEGVRLDGQSSESGHQGGGLAE